jgi:L-threonylcarbamoyladenylate synthase
VLLRPGALPLEAIARLVEVVDPGAVTVTAGERAPAPGTAARHYAPRATLRIVPAEAVREEVRGLRAQGLCVAALERAPGTVHEGPVEVLPADPGGYAASLYAALHRLDDAGCQRIVAAELPEDPAWTAVRDRLRRAAVPADQAD